MNDNDLINRPEPKKTFDGHVIGEIIVDEGGIYKVIDAGDENSYSVTTLMPRGTFVEAYNKYVKGEVVEKRPQGDLISREALKKAIQECEEEPNYQHDGETWQNGLYMAETLVDNAQAVDLWQMRQEATENALKKAEVLYGRPKGEWEFNQYDGKHNIGNWHCSECRHIVFGGKSQKPYYKFCPNCGADMRKGGAE